MNPPPPIAWTRESDRPLLHTRIFDVQAVRFRHPARDEAGEFIVIDAPDWVVAVALTPRGQLVLVRQFRFGSGELSLELPGGVVDAGETPVTAAQRELAEETGFAGPRARLLGSTFPNPAIQGNRNHIVLIEDVEPIRPLAWDVDEEIETVLWPADEALAAARDGRITHALMLNALFLFESARRARPAPGAGAV